MTLLLLIVTPSRLVLVTILVLLGLCDLITTDCRWIVHLYVTPSRLVLVTGLVLLGICGLIAIIIALLHLKEKVTPLSLYNLLL